MISLSFFKKSSPDRFPQIIKKSSIESSKNHRFWDFPIILQHMFNENQGKIPKSMIFWWFNRWFLGDFLQFFQKIIPRPVSPNHQKIIDWIIKKSSIFGFSNHFATCLMKTKGKSQNRWFFDDFPQFFQKIIPRPVPQIIKKSSIESSKNHRDFNNSQECYPKSSKKYHYSSRPRKVTWNHPRNHHFLNMSQKGYPKSS